MLTQVGISVPPSSYLSPLTGLLGARVGFRSGQIELFIFLIDECSRHVHWLHWVLSLCRFHFVSRFLCRAWDRALTGPTVTGQSRLWLVLRHSLRLLWLPILNWWLAADRWCFQADEGIHWEGCWTLPGSQFWEGNCWVAEKTFWSIPKGVSW